MKTLLLTFAVTGLTAWQASAAVTVSVSGKSDPWLAIGTEDHGDTTAGQSPASISVTAGNVLTWSATGTAGHPGNDSGPNGDSTWILQRSFGPANGISDVKSPICALLGVFVGGTPTATPSLLDFSTAASRSYPTLSPALQQVFYMGDGSSKSLVVPAGATGLYLGIMDGYEWSNNTGSFNVTVTAVPEPSTIIAGAMLLLPFGMKTLRSLRKHRVA